MNPAIVIFDNAVHRCQSDSRAFPQAFGGKKGGKNISEVVFFDAMASVADRENDVIPSGDGFHMGLNDAFFSDTTF